MKKSRIVSLIVIILLIITCIYNSIYAETIQITKEEFKEAAKNLFKEMTEGNEEGDESITVTDDEIIITSEDTQGNEEEATFQYDLTEKVKFSLKVNVFSDMTFEEYQEASAGVLLPLMYGFPIVAKVKGVDTEKAFEYLGEFLASEIMSGLSNATSFDRENFKALEYVKGIKNPSTVQDELELFAYTVTRSSETETECTLIYELKIDTDKDFSRNNCWFK